MFITERERVGVSLVNWMNLDLPEALEGVGPSPLTRHRPDGSPVHRGVKGGDDLLTVPPLPVWRGGLSAGTATIGRGQTRADSAWRDL